MPASNMPAAEHPIDAALLRGLLEDQHPDLAGLPLRALASGWDNVIFRVGDDWLARLPRRAQSAPQVEHELRWLPELAPRLPLPIPVPERVGRPGRGYPWSWSLCRWLDGEMACDAALDTARAARDLGAFLRALHTPAPAAAPINPFRGIALRERSEAFAENVAAAGIDPVRARRIFDDALAAPLHPGPRIWGHGDLHPANLLVRGGRLVAVLDFGDLYGGDPATDLAAAWMLLPAADRPAFRAAAGGVDEAGWRRARGWALHHGAACLAHSADDPTIRRVGERTVGHVLADGPG